jgi:hypothetical protein
MSLDDIRGNFKELSHLMNVKFSQIEDVKDAVRDILSY